MLAVSIALTLLLAAAAFVCGFAVAWRLLQPDDGWLYEDQGTNDPQATVPG